MPPHQDSFRQPFLLRRSEWALALAIVVAVGLTALLDANHSYATRPLESLRDIARNTALLGIFALGATVVIIAGGIDLSAGSMIALSGTVCATTMLALAPVEMMGFKPVGPAVVAVACAASLLAGFLVGTLHSWLITSIGLPPFIATLATLVGLRSFARALCESATSALTPTKSALVNVADPFFKTVRDNVWIPVAVFGVLACITWLILTRTVLGRHIGALGGNEQAARLAGIRTENVKWFAYCFGSLTAALAGIFLMADSSVAQPGNLARGYELNAIAAAVVGGCSLQGGIGTVTGTVFGALFLRLVIDAVSKLIKASADVYEGMIVGIIVALAVTLTQFGQLAKAGRTLFPGSRGLAAIPTIATFAGLLAMMGAANVEAFRGRTGLLGVVVGGGVLLLLSAIRWTEGRRVS